MRRLSHDGARPPRPRLRQHGGGAGGSGYHCHSGGDQPGNANKHRWSGREPDSDQYLAAIPADGAFLPTLDVIGTQEARERRRSEQRLPPIRVRPSPPARLEQRLQEEEAEQSNQEEEPEEQEAESEETDQEDKEALGAEEGEEGKDEKEEDGKEEKKEGKLSKFFSGFRRKKVEVNVEVEKVWNETDKEQAELVETESNETTRLETEGVDERESNGDANEGKEKEVSTEKGKKRVSFFRQFSRDSREEKQDKPQPVKTPKLKSFQKALIKKPSIVQEKEESEGEDEESEEEEEEEEEDEDSVEDDDVSELEDSYTSPVKVSRDERNHVPPPAKAACNIFVIMQI